jgi:hypothetical protein
MLDLSATFDMVHHAATHVWSQWVSAELAEVVLDESLLQSLLCQRDVVLGHCHLLHSTKIGIGTIILHQLRLLTYRTWQTYQRRYAACFQSCAAGRVISTVLVAND